MSKNFNHVSFTQWVNTTVMTQHVLKTSWLTGIQGFMYFSCDTTEIFREKFRASFGKWAGLCRFLKVSHPLVHMVHNFCTQSSETQNSREYTHILVTYYITLKKLSSFLNVTAKGGQHFILQWDVLYVHMDSLSSNNQPYSKKLQYVICHNSLTSRLTLYTLV